MCENCERNGLVKIELRRDLAFLVESMNDSMYFEVNKDPEIIAKVEGYAKEKAELNPTVPVFIYCIENMSDIATGELYERKQEAYARIINGVATYFSGIEQPVNRQLPPDYQNEN